MKAKRLAYVEKSDNSWEQLAEEYQNLDLDSFIARARIIDPSIFYPEPWEDEVDGEIVDENERYILSWDDGIDEQMWIYEKV